MALNVSDTNLKLLYGLDESGNVADRLNAAAANVTNSYTLAATTTSGVEGVPTVTDDNGGKAVNLANSITGYTTTDRWLATPIDSLADHKTEGVIQDPADWTVDDEGFTWGCRFKWTMTTTGFGATDNQMVFGLVNEDFPRRLIAIGIRPDTNLSPATGGALYVTIGQTDYEVQNGVGNISLVQGTTPDGDGYITNDGWYRCAVRAKHIAAGSEVLVDFYLYNESTNTLYQFQWQGGVLGLTFQANSYTNDNWSWQFGAKSAGSVFKGYADDGWYYNSPLSDAEVETTVETGITIPWVAPSYTYNDHDVRVAWANESSALSVPRQLPVGKLNCWHAAGAFGTRMRVHYEGTRPSRPWGLRKSEIQFDTQGPRSSTKNRNLAYDNANQGLIRRSGQLPAGSVVDCRNVEFSGEDPRRRRGYIVRRDVATANGPSANAFASFRSSDDQLFRLYKVGTALYYESGSGAVSLSTGWNPSQQPSFGVLDDRLIILTRDKQALWRGNFSGVDDFGIAAPTSGSVAATTGTLTGTYGYAYTFYDPITGDESGPREVGSVALSSEGAALSSLDTSPADSRFTQQRIYRTTADGSSPSYFFIATQNNATTYTDNGAADGTLLLPQVDSDFITGVPPDTFGAVTIHSERAFYFLGQTYPSRLYWGEANETQRWWSENFVTFEAPVTAAISYAQGLLVLTDRTVELLESDFVRDGNGSYNIRRTVLSRNVGCPGPNAVTDVAGIPFWIDRRGIYTMQGDKVVKLSRDVDNLFPYLNMGFASKFSAAHNHLRDQVWFTVAAANIQTDNTRQETVIVLQLGEGIKWTLYDTECTFVEQFDDDLNGIRFGGIDHIGCFKEYESYEGDGVDDPTDVSSCEGTISAASGGTITPTGSSPGWTVDALRGMGVVLRDVSSGAIYRGLIVSNTANDFTLVADVPFTPVPDTDTYEIGGIRSYLEFSDQNLGSSNLKALRFLYHEFDDLTAGRFY